MRRFTVALGTAVALALIAPAAAAALVVSVDFDDGAAEAYVAGALLESHGMRGTFYVNSDVIGDPGHMSWAQLAELQARGHEIAGHTRSHPRLPGLLASAGVAEVRHQVCGDQVELRRHGFDVTEFAYPFGVADAGVKAIVHDCGYRTGRTDHGIPADGSLLAETIPLPDAYWIRTPRAPTATTQFETLRDYVTQAEPAGGWLHIVFHRICDGCREYSTPEPVITRFLGWLEGEDAVEVETVRQVMDGYWASDTSPPDTSITSAPAHMPVEGSPAFEFTSSEEASRFECQLDAGAWEPCYSPASHTNLAVGTHSFAVRAIDRGRNTDPSPARHGFTIDAPLPPPAAPPPPRPRDTTVDFQLSATRSQRALRQKGIVVFVRCPAERCTAVLSASISIPGNAKRLQLRRLTKALGRGQRAKLTLRLSRKQLDQLARALRNRRARAKPIARITVSVADATRNRKTRTVTIRLTP
ncbi:MAG: polysaccharide deacetylase family protein [Nocardioidaceae bacterium]